MPVSARRSRSRGVQDEEELKKVKAQRRRQRNDRAAKWCQMVGLTIAEFILSIICFGFAYTYFHKIEHYRNQHQIKHPLNSVRYILLPPAPMAIAGTFVAITWVDLASWNSVRPVTYFGWVMVSAAGFLMFCLYSGCILLTTKDTACIIGIVFGFLTALLFLADLICLLVSLKRFPAPYWTMKRRHDRMDQCVCTADYNAEQAIVDRPICRCGDHWGEPCTCDDPDLTCGCGSGKGGKKPPCDCCECTEFGDGAGIHIDQRGKSIVSTMAGADEREEKRKSIITQCALMLDEDVSDLPYCSQIFPGQTCVDQLPDGRKVTSVLHPRMEVYTEIARQRRSFAQSQITVATQKHDEMCMAEGTTHAPYPGHHYSPCPTGTAGNRLMRASQLIPHPPKLAPEPLPQEEPQYVAPDTRSRRFTTTSQFGEYANPSARPSVSPSRMAGPSMVDALHHGIQHDALTHTIGTPSTAATRASRMVPGDPRSVSRKSIHMAYALYDSTLDNKEAVKESIASKYATSDNKSAGPSKPVLKKSIFYDASGKPIDFISKSSTDDENGEGDFGKRKADKKKSHSKDLKLRHRYSTHTLLESGKHGDSEMRYKSDLEAPLPQTSLPGQVECLDDRGRTHGYRSGSPRKKVTVSAKSRTEKRDSCTQVRPKTSFDSFSGVKLVRNVSTTVKAARTLSRVMEATEVESKTVENQDGYPSSATITLKKPKK